MNTCMHFPACPRHGKLYASSCMADPGEDKRGGGVPVPSIASKMASLVPWTGGTIGGGYDPLFSGVWDPSSISSNWLFEPSWRTRDDTTLFARTFVDWRETPDAHIFRADIPGVRREEVKVQVEDGNVLEISGERTKEEDKGKDRWHRVERRRGRFRRRFRLPGDADMDKVKSSLEHGVLTVTVPKMAGAVGGPSVRAIDIS